MPSIEPLGESRYPCACCGYVVHSELPGSDDICPICGWQDDISQLRFPTLGGGANGPSLVEAQQNFVAYGTSDPTKRAKSPAPSVTKDPNWRPINLEFDKFEVEELGRDYGNSYPADPRTLYYWSECYWRK